MSFRKIIFWLHLIAGVIAGVVVFIMSATGVALAFEKEIVAWAERDLRRVQAPPGGARLPLDELLGKVRAAYPALRPSGVTIYQDPAMVVSFSMGRTNGVYVNPYNGEMKAYGAKGLRAFMQTMIEWHRYLGRQENQRPLGKAITGACNAAFCFLGITGLYLWWPRQWVKTVLRGIVFFNFKLRGKARDWNWHNVFGLWSAPILIVLTATAMPISYRWAGDFIYKVTRSEPPPPAGAGSPAPQVSPPPSGSQPLTHEELLAAVQQQALQWREITLRLTGGGPRSGGEGRAREGATNPARAQNSGNERAAGDRRAPQPATFAVKQQDGSPRFATALFTLDPFTGKVLRAEKFSDYNLGRQVRSWTRFLHTGEALGPLGQLVAGLASLGGVMLVYTGFALACRRFWRFQQSRRNPTTATAPVTSL